MCQACGTGTWRHISHHPCMGDGAISASREITMLSSSFHSTALQRSEERMRWVLDRKWFWDFPAPLSQEMSGVMGIPKGGRTYGVPVHLCVCTCIKMYVGLWLAYIFMWVHMCICLYLCGGTCADMCLWVYAYAVVHNLRCHPRTLFFLGFKWEPLTDLDLT